MLESKKVHACELEFFFLLHWQWEMKVIDYAMGFLSCPLADKIKPCLGVSDILLFFQEL